MKNIPMILLLLMPYVIMGFGSWIAAIPNLYGFIPFAVILFGNMIYAFFLPRLGYDGKQIMFWDMLLKLCNIPAFLALFIIGGVMVMIKVEDAGLITFVLLYVLLLSSTLFGVNGLIWCYKEGIFSGKELAIHLILHFIFFTDVLSAARCYGKIPGNEPESEEEPEWM